MSVSRKDRFFGISRTPAARFTKSLVNSEIQIRCGNRSREHSNASVILDLIMSASGFGLIFEIRCPESLSVSGLFSLSERSFLLLYLWLFIDILDTELAFGIFQMIQNLLCRQTRFFSFIGFQNFIGFLAEKSHYSRVVSDRGKFGQRTL